MKQICLNISMIGSFVKRFAIWSQIPPFPERFRKIREERGLSQRELTQRCHLGTNQINRYENGVTEPSITVLQVIATQLGVTADYLIGLSDNPTERPTDAGLNDAERD